MAVKKVLESVGKFTGGIPRLKSPTGIRVKSRVLCECNEEYDIEEKFTIINGSSSRATECQSCHDKTYLSYEIETKKTQYVIGARFTGNVDIKPKATAIRSKTLKQEDTDIELLYK